MKRMIDDKIINKLSIKNGVLEIKGTVNTDKITGDEIVENMSGYSASIPVKVDVNAEFTNIYSGAVKNGNKLTLVASGTFKRTGDLTTYGEYFDFVDFIVPLDIHNKLYPFTDTDFGQLLSNQNIPYYASVYTDDITIRTLAIKNNDGHIIIRGIGLNNLTVDVDYYVRFEITFLLGDNLIS